MKEIDIRCLLLGVVKKLEKKMINIKKNFLVITFLVVLPLEFAIAEPGVYMKKGDIDVGATIGLGTIWGGFPIGAQVEYGVERNIGVGAYVGHWAYSSGCGNLLVKISCNYTFHYTVIPVGMQALYHFNEILKIDIDKLDLSAGIILGYWIYSVSVTDSSGNPLNGIIGATTSHLGWASFLQARYFVTPKLGLKARLGYGLGILSLGADYKL